MTIACVPSGERRTTPPRASAAQSVPSGSARIHSGRWRSRPTNCTSFRSIPKSRIGLDIAGHLHAPQYGGRIRGYLSKTIPLCVYFRVGYVSKQYKPMTATTSSDLGPFIADRIRSANRQLAERWLERLRVLVPVDPADIFPTDQMLDHVPALIHEIAGYVEAGTSEAIAANTSILSKAQELGELRFAQQASVHQLLREYRILEAVLAHFVKEQLTSVSGPAAACDSIDVLLRLNEAVFVLLQMTVDTFVDRYTRKIEEQTTRLEGFNRMVSHELRQPLSSVQYAVELLGSDAARDEAKRSHLAEVGNRNVKRLSDLIRMLGTLARPDHDNLQMQTVDVSRVAGEAVRQLRDLAQATGVAVRNHVEAGDLTVDVARLELVLVNLLSNAIKYRDPAKGAPFVEIGLQTLDGMHHLYVRDNGLGIREADQPAVFRRFYRGHADRDAELGNEGVGLGLAIAAECVKAMGGSIQLQSAEGAGTTFTIALPDRRSASDA